MIILYLVLTKLQEKKIEIMTLSLKIGTSSFDEISNIVVRIVNLI